MNLGSRKLWARGLLVAGLAFAGTQAFRSVPRDQRITLVSTDQSFQQVELSWKRVGDDAALGGVTFHFEEPGQSRVSHAIRVPNGRYELDIRTLPSKAASAEASDASNPSPTGQSHGGYNPLSQETLVQRQVNLQGGETIVRL